MSDENVELVRRMYEDFAARGLEMAVDYLDPEIEWLPPKDAPHPEAHRGVEGARAELAEWMGQFHDYAWEPREFVAAPGGRVVVIGRQRGRGRASGVDVTAEETHLWTLRGGRAVRLEMFATAEEALEAVGLGDEAMPQENVEVVRRAIEAFNRGDLDGFARDADPDIEVDWSRSRGLEAGVYRGDGAAQRFVQTFLDAFEEVTVIPEELIEVGDHVVIANRARLRGRDGIEVQARSGQVVTLRAGRIVRWTLYQEKAEALEAVGLRE